MARQRRADERFPASAQRALLRLVRQGRPISEAAVIAYARRHCGFAARLEKAREGLCRERRDCGSGQGWRSGCRGLWCWQQHCESQLRAPSGFRGRPRADAQARALGYTDAAAFLEAHPEPSTRYLAAVLGVGRTSIRRWRQPCRCHS